MDYQKWRNSIVEAAKERWLTPEEIHEILTNHELLGFKLSIVKPHCPRGGEMYLFDRNVVPDFKSDGIDWVKKKGSSKENEQYLKLLTHGVHTVTGLYATASADSFFRRRCYRLAPSKAAIYLVHYRHCAGDAYMRRPSQKSQQQSHDWPEQRAHPQGQSEAELDALFDDAIDYQIFVDLGRGDSCGDSSPVLCMDLENDGGLGCGAPDGSMSPSPALPPLFVPVGILDFSPPSGGAGGGTKILLCLDAPIQIPPGRALGLFSSSGGSFPISLSVPVEVVAPCVLRLLSPPLSPSCLLPCSCTISVVSDENVLLAGPSQSPFIFEPPVAPPIPPTPSSLMDESRTHKIRIVERLLTQTTDSSHLRSPGPMFEAGTLYSPAQSEDGWLDDKALSTLSSADLERLMDQFLLRVVQQLVQIATMDDDLQAELDHLDPSGYSLLHYCCLFNLPTLVSKLIDKGVNVNRLTRCGSTALHLAAHAGHGDVVHLLVEAGADITIRNASGLTPAESSLQAGHPSLSSYWSRLCPADADVPASIPVSAPCHTNLRSSPMKGQFSTSPIRVSSPDTVPPEKSSLREGPQGTPEVHMHVSDPPLATTCAADNRSSMCSPPSSSGVSSPTITLESMSGETGVSNMTLLQGALSSLSLTDKCALSLSLGGGQSGARTPDDFEVQSVLSETDKESLDLAMSMMGPQEINAVEEEVRLIQSNVRTWLLRKNYTNLRDAARILQLAWRERRGGSVSRIRKPREPIPSSTLSIGAGEYEARVGGKRKQESRDIERDLVSSVSKSEREEAILSSSADPTRSITSDEAAATLQAATRGMLARKSFRRVKRQAMASLVIQKSLFQWWIHKGGAQAFMGALDDGSRMES
mmetsp:Transcript_15268/g.22982  ORF Transcript_15268/g.22982 Transcript_15268/m.22982 type:complete len:868 (+) Transcript_15268:91-2694(+)